jgi:hypothetical protein
MKSASPLARHSATMSRARESAQVTAGRTGRTFSSTSHARGGRKPRFGHAARPQYSWIRPPSRSSRRISRGLTVIGTSSFAVGGARPRARWGARCCSGWYRSEASDRDVADSESASSRGTPPGRFQSPAPRRRWHWGARMGVRITLAPSERKTSSNGPTNLVSRSRMRNRMAVGRSSSSIVRLRACWVTHAASGCTVEELRWIRLLPTSMKSRT